MTTHFGENRLVFGQLLSDFWSTSPKIEDFYPQISPFLPTGASQNDRNQSKYAVTGWNQSYIPMTTHFGEHRRLFGKLLSDFSRNSSSTSPLAPKNLFSGHIYALKPTFDVIYGGRPY